MNLLFARPTLPTLTTTQFPNDLAAQLDYILSAVNTLEQQQAQHILWLHGVGRVNGQGCTLSVSSGTLRLADGYFYAGPGVASSAGSYFPGARLVQVQGANSVGYIEATGSNMPPLNQADGVYGFMSYYGDVIWDASLLTPRPNDRWCIGKVVTDASGAVSVDDTVADILSLAGSGGGGGTPFDATAIYAAIGLWPYTNVVSIDGRLVALEAATGTGITGGSLPSDNEYIRRLITTGAVVKDHPEEFLNPDWPGSLNFPGITGNAETLPDGVTIAQDNNDGGDMIEDIVAHDWE